MVWTAPRTYVVGEMITTAILNQQVQGNLLFIGTLHNHASAGATAGTAALGTLNSVSFRDVGGAPAGTVLQVNGSLFWNQGAATYNLNNFVGATTAALLRVGTIEATTGGTLAADGTHNHAI